MKKTLLLSVVASTMIMAGGDIAPVEPAVEVVAPAPVAEVSGWDFDGNAVAYYQTADAAGTADLGDGATTSNDLGIQLRATNKDLFYGIGAGVELSGLYSSDEFSSRRIQNAAGNNGGEITQAYLTYGMGNTSLKLGRQHLPKGLSPFAFTESWQPLKNSFDAALVVNTDISDTTLVYAYVTKSNNSLGDIDAFTRINQNGSKVHMLTAQNKSVDGLTLTGSYYFAPDIVADGDDINVLWGDAKFAVSDYSIGLQGGQISMDANEDTAAFGAKVGADFGGIHASVAYSTVDDGTHGIVNFGTGVKTPLYTQMILNQGHISSDNDTFVIRAGMEALGGTFGVAYDITDDGANANSDYTELDVTYKTNLTENTTLFAAYILSDDDAAADSTNIVRVWARYNF